MSLSKTVWCCNKIFSSVKNPASVLELSANWYRDSQCSSGSSSVNLNAIDSRLKAQVSSFGNSKGKIQIIQQAKDFSNGQTKKLKKEFFVCLAFLCCSSLSAFCTVASWLVFSTPEWEFWVRALPGVTLVFLIRQDTYCNYNCHRIRSDEGLTLETSALESLYGGQFTLSTPAAGAGLFKV